MRCPYRKIYTKDALRFGESAVQDLEEFPECHGESCPLYDARLVITCLRATRERNDAYIMLEARNE